MSKPILAAVSALLFPTSGFAVTVASIDLATTGVYDENLDQTNTVDATAPSSAGLAPFSLSIAAAHASNRGGVITFDEMDMSTSTDTGVLNVTYGASGTGLLVISKFGPSISGTNGNFFFEANSALGTPISGGTFDTFLRSRGQGTTNGTQGYAFSTPLETVAFTVLSRTGGRNITATVTYTNGETAELLDAVASGAGGDDTFFAFEAPVGLGISSLSITAGTDASSFFAIDDLAFIIPEPSSALLAGFSLAALLGCRRV